MTLQSLMAILCRFLRAVFTLLFCVTLVFVVLRTAGDPAEQLLPPETPPDVVSSYREAWGLDAPIVVPYVVWLKNVARGGFGQSVASHRPVVDLVAETMLRTLALGGSALLLASVLGLTPGIAAALRRGSLTDRARMAGAVPGYAMPVFFLGTLLFALQLRILLFIVLVSLEGGERHARLARRLVLSEQNSDHIRAGEGLGAASGRVVFCHLLPNIAAALVVQATLNFPGTILLESSLSFLGLGIQPPNASLGLMPGEGRRCLLNAWWIAVLPGLVIFLTALAMSLFGDGLCDRLDPTLGRR